MKKNIEKTKGFSLIELMVSMGILSVLMLILTVVLDQVQRSWTYSESRVSQFREARVAFDIISKNLAQASLNSYYDLRQDGAVVSGYEKVSELHFLTVDASKLPTTRDQEPVGEAIFFQAPLGYTNQFRNLNNLFNGRGYFVSFGSDRLFKPRFVTSEDQFRYRIMEFRPPAEANQVFVDGLRDRLNGDRQEFDQWYRQSANIGSGDFEDYLNPLAENIVALIVSPRDSISTGSRRSPESYSEIAPDYSFDSNDEGQYEQLIPPLVRVTMIAIDEDSATRLADGSSAQPETLREINSSYFRTTRQYDNDINRVSNFLNGEGINHKIFSSMVMLRSAKWSSSAGTNSGPGGERVD